MRTEIKIALQIFGLKIELGIFMPWTAVGIEAGSPKGGWQQGHARCGGDFRSPRKAAMPPDSHRGLPLKARNRHQKTLALHKKFLTCT
jgi:hypothetical protein